MGYLLDLLLVLSQRQVKHCTCLLRIYIYTFKCILIMKCIQVFVSDCLGVQWIGYVIVSYSISGAVAGIVVGRTYRFVPEFLLIYAGVILGGSLTLFLIFWNRMPSYLVVFSFAIGWGLCDGVWQSLVSGYFIILI